MAVRKARALTQSLLELKQDAGIEIPRFKYHALINESAAEADPYLIGYCKVHNCVFKYQYMTNNWLLSL
ncbi:MAG: hypothetical protein WC865_12920 [Bacteroidales bacterium]